MTPQPGKPSTSGGGFLTGLAVGLGVTALFLCLGSVVGYSYVKKRAADARKGWNLVPVVVAAVDIAEDSVVTFDQISQRSIPEQFVTTSVVKPDSASYIVNQKILVPVQAGDPLLWSQFETKKKPVMLFAGRDIPVGGALDEKDIEERPVPAELLTSSWIRTEDRPQTVGRKVMAPFRKGDPLLWTHLKADDAK
ncbi:MAG: hypothetical protein AMXMBFR34_37460 [Myxococcaceae bacterium]